MTLYNVFYKGDSNGNPYSYQATTDNFESMTYEVEYEKCRYCGGDCPNDEENVCDGYLGDIDNLYGTRTDLTKE